MGCGSSAPTKRSPTFRRIPDTFESIEEVQDALRKGGLESSDLIVAVDFTKSNEWSGRTSFGGRSLHALDTGVPNPYQQVITIMCRTLAAFDDDRMIPTYGFGDAQTRHDALFSFLPNEQPVHELVNILKAYNDIAAGVELSGGTSFAPAINKAIDIVIKSGKRYHILVIVADGQVSPECMAPTVDAIVRASHYPLSIVMVGVGDGPWDDMIKFDDGLPSRKFDNFQFVNFSDLMAQASCSGYSAQKCEGYFALNALMEIPEQFKIARSLKLATTQAPDSAAPKAIKVLAPPSANRRYSQPLNINAMQ